MSLRHFRVICLALLLAAGAPPLTSYCEQPELRWLYLQKNLQVGEHIPEVEQLLNRAADAGYNGVVLADYKLNILDRVPDHYFTNARRVAEVCRQRKLEVIPCVASFGYSSGILAHDPNLAEALPVKGARLVMRGTQAVPVIEPANLIPGQFEDRREHAFTGWRFQDEPGSGTYADREVKHGGETSLRIENPAGVRGNRRVMKSLTVRPWTQYHASVWIRAEDFESARDVRMFAMGANGRTLSYSFLGVKRDQPWTQHHVIFNSLENETVNFYLGVWDAGSGKCWFDDAAVTELPLVNLVRRPDCPLNVTNADGTIRYEEGRDFAPLHDEKLGISPWQGEFDVYHAPPVLRRLAGSRIDDGQQLLIDYYHAVTIYDNQVPCSLTAPKVFEVVRDQVRRVNDLLQPRTFFLSHDEIRVANWSEADRASGRTAGEQLAENVRRCTAIIHEIQPAARLCFWSDMFDPSHNAVDNYYLVNGDLAGSWNGLPADAIVINWNSGKANESLAFFANRGHAQVLAGFYDGPVERLDPWLAEARKHGGPRGVMYTTWQGDFSKLEAFAERAWGSD